MKTEKIERFFFVDFVVNTTRLRNNLKLRWTTSTLLIDISDKKEMKF